MQSHSDARLWEMKYWKKMSSSQCSAPVKKNSPAKRSVFSILRMGRWRLDAQLEAKCKEDGAVLVADGVICQEEPDDEAVENCKALGKALA